MKNKELIEDLKELEICFDSSAEHHYGTKQPGKGVFVPLNLWKELMRRIDEESWALGK